MSNVLFFVVDVHDDLHTIFAYAFLPLSTSLVMPPDKDLIVFQSIAKSALPRGTFPHAPPMCRHFIRLFGVSHMTMTSDFPLGCLKQLPQTILHSLA